MIFFDVPRRMNSYVIKTQVLTETGINWGSTVHSDVYALISRLHVNGCSDITVIRSRWHVPGH